MKFGKDPQPITLDNTTYALFDVNPKDDDTIKLKGRSRRRPAVGVSLVGRDGNATSGTVERLTSYSEGGEKTSVSLPDAQSYNRITAVVTNADGHVTGSKPIFGEFLYTRNDEDFKLKVRR